MVKRKDWKKIVIERSVKEQVKILTELEKDKYPREKVIYFICSSINCEKEHHRKIRYIV